MIAPLTLTTAILTIIQAVSSLPQPSNDTSKSESLTGDDVICIDPSPFYLDWAGTKLVRKDCYIAWQGLLNQIRPGSGTQRPFTYWFQPPAPSARLTLRTPIGSVEGTCHVAVAMIRSIPVRGPDGRTRVLPERMSFGYSERPLVDEAIAGDISDAVDRNAWCLDNRGLPGAWFAGKQDGIGVFFWSSDSAISSMYREPVGDGLEGGIQLGSGGNMSAFEIFAR